MALERVELRLSASRPAEARLIAQLDALDDEYGAKSDYIKERLMRGFTIIESQMADLLAEPMPLAALDRDAGQLDLGSAHYRVLKVLLQARLSPGEPRAPAKRPPAPVRAPTTAPEPVVATPAIAAAPPQDSVGQIPQVAMETRPAASDTFAASTDALVDRPPTPLPAEAAEALPVMSPAVVVAPPPPGAAKPNWGAFAGIAGVRGKEK